MIYTRFGGEIKIVRYATKADVMKLDPPFNDEAKLNLASKSWALAELHGESRIVRTGDLRADGGWEEISTALGATWQCPDCEQDWPHDERCHNDKCHQKYERRLTAWRKRSA